MKYFKRAGIYKNHNGNCTLDPNKVEAWSYHWWQFLKIIEGKVVFNDYRYSPTTGKHQGQVRDLLEELSIKVDLFLPISGGLQNKSSLEGLNGE